MTFSQVDALKYTAEVINHFQTCIENFFCKALAVKKARVWVCASDQVTLSALEFLRKHNIRVPEDIAVIGFDDTINAFRANLTSYNFNITAYASAILDFICGGQRLMRSRSGPAGEWVELPGMIIERKSTARMDI